MKIAIALLSLVFCMAFIATTHAVNDSEYDEYGGWKKIAGQKTGYFHTQKTSGKWWLVSPEGNVFFSKGVNSVHPPFAESFHGGADVAAGFLKSWGMNTAGCWSDPDLFKEHVAVAYRLKITGAPSKDFPDVFDPAWRAGVERAAQTLCLPYRNNPWILGYFTDNERPWKHDDKAEDFVKEFLKMPPSSPGYKEALRAKNSGSLAMKSFREKAAELYFRTTAEAVRKADPNHMILGCRFAGTPPLGVVGKMKGYADVISINNYMEHPPVKLLKEMSDAADLPVMVTEFSFKAPAGALPMTGSGPEKPTQTERALGFHEYAREVATQGFCVGYHWFKYGENWQGTLQSDGTPWPELTKAFADLNRSVEQIHQQ